MKKILPYIIGLLLLGGLVAYFVHRYSPSSMEKAESEFAVRDIENVTKICLTTQDGLSVTVAKKGKKWMLNDKYEANEEALGLLLGSIQKLETQYQVPGPAQALIMNELQHERSRCEIYMNGESEPSKVYDVGGPTPDGIGTYMIMEINGKFAPHSYVTQIPGIRAYLTQRYYPDAERWRSIWIFRDDNRTIDNLKVEYNREKEKSFEIRRVAEDSFVIANSEGKVAEQPKQRHMHQYLDFYSALPMLYWKNKDKALQDSILPQVPYCTITMKRRDKTESKAVVYYIPISEMSRVQVDELTGRKLIYDIENLYLSFNDRKDFAMIQYHTWGSVFHSYDEFFRKAGETGK